MQLYLVLDQTAQRKIKTAMSDPELPFMTMGQKLTKTSKSLSLSNIMVRQIKWHQCTRQLNEWKTIIPDVAVVEEESLSFAPYPILQAVLLIKLFSGQTLRGIIFEFCVGLVYRLRPNVSFPHMQRRHLGKTKIEKTFLYTLLHCNA